MILGLGIDLIEIDRIERAIQKEHFLRRIYSPCEQAAIASRGAQTAAGYFAAKEAVAKALGTGFGGFSFSDISVENDELGKPECVLTGGASARMREMGGKRVLISITHTGSLAQAIALIESE